MIVSGFGKEEAEATRSDGASRTWPDTPEGGTARRKVKRQRGKLPTKDLMSEALKMAPRSIKGATYTSIISLFSACTMVVIPSSLALIITSSISPSPSFKGTYVIYSFKLLIPSRSTISGSSSAKIFSDGLLRMKWKP